MAICGISCIFAIVIIIANIAMTYFMSINPTMKEYESQLPPELIVKYREIAQERFQLYMKGYTLGFALSIFIVLVIYLTTKHPNSLSLLCFVFVFSYFIAVIHYMFSPKTDWMLNHIDDEKQAKAWLNMYRYMKNTYHTSFGIGLIAVGIYLFSFRCSKFVF